MNLLPNYFFRNEVIFSSLSIPQQKKMVLLAQKGVGSKKDIPYLRNLF